MEVLDPQLPLQAATPFRVVCRAVGQRPLRDGILLVRSTVARFRASCGAQRDRKDHQTSPALGVRVYGGGHIQRYVPSI